MFAFLQHIPRVEARAAMISVTVGIALLIVKYVAYYLTQSAAIFSDATESIANVLASAVALYSLVVAHRPADAEHPYGHGKIEFLSAWFEASMVLLAALFIISRTIDAVWHNTLASEETVLSGIVLMAFAMVTNGVVGVYLIRTGRTHGSITLIADGKHLITDVYTSAGVLVALGLVKMTGYRMLDPIAAFVVAGYIVVVGVRLLKQAAGGIMDRQDLADEQLISNILESHCGPAGKLPRICNYHKLRHRHSGRYHWVDFHLRLPPTVDVRAAHDIASAIELEIEAAIEGNATAHVEPCDQRRCQPSGICQIFEGYTVKMAPPDSLGGTGASFTPLGAGLGTLTPKNPS